MDANASAPSKAATAAGLTNGAHPSSSSPPVTTSPAQDPAALAKILNYAQTLARNEPSLNRADPPERGALLAARDALFVGPKRGPAGPGARKRRKLDESIANRPCSPSLFSLATSNPAPPAVGAKRNAPLTEKLEYVLSSNVTPLYERPGAASQGPVEDDKLMQANRYTSLGHLLLPIRRPSVMEKWTAYEIAIFESGLCLHGKNFDVIKALLPNKTLKEVIEFYYVWKNTSHKPVWKKTFKPVET